MCFYIVNNQNRSYRRYIYSPSEEIKEIVIIKKGCAVKMKIIGADLAAGVTVTCT
jgi:hypothetical protein